MKKPTIGVVGLGNIAQKAYLPILTKEENWSLAGAYSRSKIKREAICSKYRMNSFNSLSSLISTCDAVFVHSITESHYEVVNTLLSNGVDVYVDKPLASNLEDAEKLVECSEKKGRKLMVGFNRRFAPLYVRAKQMAKGTAWINMEKHRADSVGPQTVDFTMLDDYIHLVDTLRWLGDGNISLTNQFSKINQEDQLIFAKHLFQSGSAELSSAMHRKAGTNLESLEIVNEDQIIRVKNNMHTFEEESAGQLICSTPPSWETSLETKGFAGSVNHFISCLQQDTKPTVDGLEALKTQQLVQDMMDQLRS